jgi:formylglycine-generating enzyme required for sulfatase activity
VPPINPDSDEKITGDYHLKELVSENPVSRTWLAEQISISRSVLIEELRPECIDQKEAFLADVRAKASVDHPLIGSVYEAVAGEDRCFFAYERLPGATLEDRLEAGASLPPGRMAKLLRRVSEAELHHEAANRATAPLTLTDIHLDEHGVVRLGNTAIAGPRDPAQATQDIAFLGEALRPLVADGQPGTTRMFTLLAWMRGEGLETALNWRQTGEICDQIEQQLSSPSPGATTRTMTRTRRPNGTRLTLAIAGVVVLLAIGVLAIRLRQHCPAPAPRPPMPDAILIPAGSHPTPDGTTANLKAFRISPHEVTIGQYAAFLEALETLSKNNLERTFDHRDQPAEKTSHLPDDWAALFAAAKAKGIWNQQQVTLETPVVGIDWWDAAAYAEWKKGHLPSQEQWFAAVRHKVEKPAAIPPADWTTVAHETSDRTPAGLLGMAGSACEWTGQLAANPANPLGARQWVIIGGSFLKPGSNALSREWTPDRSLRRPDLGFRLVFDAH